MIPLTKNILIVFVFGTTDPTWSVARGVCVSELCVVVVINSHTCVGKGPLAVPEVNVIQGARVHLTRSSLERDDTSRLSCLFHHRCLLRKRNRYYANNSYWYKY